MNEGTERKGISSVVAYALSVLIEETCDRYVKSYGCCE